MKTFFKLTEKDLVKNKQTGDISDIVLEESNSASLKRKTTDENDHSPQKRMKVDNIAFFRFAIISSLV